MFVNIFAPNIGESKFIKSVLTDLKGEVLQIAIQ